MTMNIINFLKVFCLAIVVCLSSVQLNGQEASRLFSDLNVKNKVSITFFGLHHFDNEENGFYPGIITTERTGKKGFVNFSRGSSWKGASELQHVDGFVCVYHSEPFTFPIGSDFKYRPVAISGARASDAAYFDINPVEVQGVSSNLDTEVKDISAIEYWDINGENRSHITLTWDEYSGIRDLTKDEISTLSIVGWKNNRWEVIPSKIDENMLDISVYNAMFKNESSSFEGGSITTLEAIPLNSYDYYTFGAISSYLSTAPEVVNLDFSIYPNPHILGGVSKLSFSKDNNLDKSISIYNANEQLVYTTTLKGNQQSMLLDNVAQAPGVYTIQVKDSKGFAFSKNLIIVDR